VTGNRTVAWPYEKGHVNRDMLSRYLCELNGPIYYIAGPSGMVTAMTDVLHSSGVSYDDMKTEEFGEYKWYDNVGQRVRGESDKETNSAR
jgi:NAD(P)H-flavin reductase